MKEAHKTLWLQWEGDGEGEVTWCQDAINEDDIEYIRADIVQAQLAALSWARWVSVDERLPENDAIVLFYDSLDGLIITGYYNDEYELPWSGDDDVTYTTVTHWMPLPPAPAREETI